LYPIDLFVARRYGEYNQSAGSSHVQRMILCSTHVGLQLGLYYITVNPYCDFSQ